MIVDKKRIKDLLTGLSVFDGLDPETLDEIALTVSLRRVPTGETLIEQDSRAESLYLVASGRFRVARDGQAIATVGVGEPLGELSFFSGGRRTASVSALRDSEVLSLTREGFEAVARHHAALPQAILATVSARLAAVTAKAPVLSPMAGLVVSVGPVAGGEPLPELLVDGLLRSAEKMDHLNVHTADTAPVSAGPDALAEWFAPLERAGERHILLVRDPQAEPDWARFAETRSDSRFRVGRLDATPPAPHPDALAVEPRDHLVLWRPASTTPISGTTDWLSGRDLAMHHHLALDDPGDFARLLRFASDRALGLVLAGGGAFGTAHVGAFRAMFEAGIPVDFIGGTSVGAAMAAAIAQALPADEIMRRCNEIFVTSRAMNRLNVPLYSVLDHRVFDAQLAKHFGDGLIEDLAMPFFAVSSNLSCNDIHVHRSGPLWKAVRSSGSIPALLPPVLTDEGDVLIDGGLLDNVPLDAMRLIKSGPNIVFDFNHGNDWRVQADYDALPGRLGALRGFLFKRSRKNRFPRIPSILSRSMIINSRREAGRMDMGRDILVRLPTAPRASFLDWTKGQQNYEIGHRALAGALAGTDPAAAPDARLREAVRNMAVSARAG
ncbi:MAG TPA: cyclic nucleotide-binding and patatin-like phospholipase domain-containing protein [Roseovarius sp.]|nr:cyclic nucleotide-binding and patatin-like phospholipase domain-containing protein [Roseovarius sp.]